MIRYDLICEQGHAFDGWFRDSAAFDTQAAEGLVVCAACGSAKVGKQLMAPGIPAKSNRKAEVKVAGGGLDPRAQQLMQMMREMRRHVEQNSEYVGTNFAEEARKIHYDEAEKRGIYGEATSDDAKALMEEGIDVHPLPRLPEDGN
ncbi:DUF1178 family protein [Aestuariivirga sp.]|uniref:DUF1178 family protein n=1 Tax=Aestuariivirga sp. TaxID=2650926 RepID=UPI0039E64850